MRPLALVAMFPVVVVGCVVDVDLPSVPPPVFWTTVDPAQRDPSSGEVHGCRLPTPFDPVERPDDPDGGGAGAIATDGWRTLFYSGPRGITPLTVEDDGRISGERPLIPVDGFVHRIASNGAARVYFVDPSTGALESQLVADASAQTARQLATGLDPTTALRADDACVYWVDAHADAVMMVHQ